MNKYSLSNEVLLVNGEKRKYSHVYFMEHVTYARIDELIKDLRQDGAFPPQDSEHAGKQIKQCFESHPGSVLQTNKEQQMHPPMLVRSSSMITCSSKHFCSLPTMN